MTEPTEPTKKIGELPAPSPLEPTAHCPTCDGTDIRESNVSFVELPVTQWNFDGKNGPQPVGWDWDVAHDAEWETEDTPFPYVCKDCRWVGTLADLVVRRPEVSNV